MFTINFKSKSNVRDTNQIKIEMIIYCPGYARVPKVTNVIGIAKDWDEKTQMFNLKSPDATEKNKTLAELKGRYETVAKQWNKEGKAWSPRQLSHCFETEEKKKEEVKVLPVSQCIDVIVEQLKNRKRFKNGKVLSSVSTANSYYYFKNTLDKFTQDKYERKFSTYFFNEINEQFVKDFVLYTQEQGAKNGNKAGLVPKLRLLYGVFCYSAKMNMPDTDVSVLACTKPFIKRKKAEPQTIDYDLIPKIEAMDKSKFTKLERFYIDIFLFSFYAGGIIGIDICFLTWSCIEKDLICRERIKFPKESIMPFNNKAKAIVEKYRDKCCDDYVLPLFTHKHTTEEKQRNRLRGVQVNMSETLKKVSKKLRCQEFGWYAARGTFITKMLDEGFHPIAVAEFAGNSPKTIYEHYWKQTKHEDVLASMNKMF
jgi:site-specific recombinase XerD